jgi:hypothetical protein
MDRRGHSFCTPHPKLEETLMSEGTDRPFREADAAIEHTVAAFKSAIEQMLGRWDAVAPACILEGVLLEIGEELRKLNHDPRLSGLRPHSDFELLVAFGEYRRATLRLSRALSDYWEEPGAAPENSGGGPRP